MTINMVEPSAPADLAAIERVEQRIGTGLPRGFRAFLLGRHNGGPLEPNSIESPGGLAVGASITGFLGVGRGDVWDFEHRHAQYQDRLPRGFIAIADAEGGNLLCMSTSQEDAVWFWDHESEVHSADHQTPKELTVVADNFDDLLDCLVPADSLAGVDPPQAEEVWVDPELLREWHGPLSEG